MAATSSSTLQPFCNRFGCSGLHGEVLADFPDPKSLISEMTVVQVEQLLPEVTEGMIPKLESVLHAISHGCESVQIVNGSTEHSLMNALAKNAHSGTVITK
jgi:acetylglutamate kinase